MSTADSDVTRSYAVLDESELSESTGSLVGLNEGSLSSCYTDSDTTDASSVGVGSDSGVSTLTTDEMTGNSPVDTMPEFDFDTLWVLRDSYPLLEFALNILEIESLQDLDKVRSNLAAQCILMNDIDASETANWEGTWTPIGSESNPFIGTFEGQGYEVSDLFCEGENAGLFNYVEGATITGVGVSYGSANASTNAGGLAIQAVNSSVDRSYVQGVLSGAGDYLGGLIGKAESTSVKECYFEGELAGGAANVGGLLSVTLNPDVQDCYSIVNDASLPTDFEGIFGGFIGGLDYENTIVPNWPMFQVDLANSGTLETTGIASNPVESWRFEPGDLIISSPAVVDGVIYFGCYNSNVYAVDEESQTEKWSYSTDNDIRCSPTVVDGTVYIGSEDNSMHAIDAENGEGIWTFATGDYVYSSPAVVDGTVFFGSEDNNFYAVDAATGEEIWRFGTGNIVQSSPAVVNGTVFFGSYDGFVYALDAATGDTIWSYDTGYAIRTSPTVKDGTVYIGGHECFLHALDAETGSVNWSFQTDDRVSRCPSVANGTVFFQDHMGTVYAVDIADGSENWRIELEQTPTAPIVVDGTVYIGCANGDIYALDPATGDQIWSFVTGGDVPVSLSLIDGTIYAPSDDILYMIEEGN